MAIRLVFIEDNPEPFQDYAYNRLLDIESGEDVSDRPPFPTILEETISETELPLFDPLTKVAAQKHIELREREIERLRKFIGQ